MVRSTDIFPEGNSDAQVKAAKEWLSGRGIKELDPVPLGTETFEKVTMVFYVRE